MVSFTVLKLLGLITFHLFIFACFFSFALEDWSKKIFLWFMSKTVLPMSSSRNFMVSILTFRSLIYFKFIFVYGVRECSNLILLYVSVYFSRTNSLRDCLFSFVYLCLLCCRLIAHRCIGLFLDSLFCSIDLCVCFCTSTMLCWLLVPYEF